MIPIPGHPGSSRRVRIITRALMLAISSLVYLCAADPADAQLEPTHATSGSVPHETAFSGAYDTINLADLEIFVRIPVRNKIGPMPFSYSLKGSFPGLSNDSSLLGFRIVGGEGGIKP